MTDDDPKARVRAQFAAAGDAYVRSAGHATGPDLQRMLALATPSPTDRMLDIATGGGHVARTFAPLVASVIASDLTPEILTHAEKAFADHGLENVETAIADAEDVPFGDATFDIVTCRIAPHHFPRPDRFVQEVARVLAPGGRFILVDSTVEPGPNGDAFNAVEKLRDPAHVRSLTIAAWQVLIAEAGLQILATETFDKTHDFADWVGRSGCDPATIARIEARLRDGDDAFRDIHHVTIADGHVVSFTDTKTLFAALKPDA
jgi:ubiquinone/menaquinone biosynthesis C-methylase UbiE